MVDAVCCAGSGPAEMGSRARSAQWPCCCTAMIATPLAAAAGDALGLATARAGGSTGTTLPALERFQARDGTWLASVTIAPRAGRPIAARSSCTARPAPAAPSTRAGSGARGTRRRDLGARHPRPWRLRHARRHRLCRPTRRRSRRFRRACPQDAVRQRRSTLIGHSAGGGFSLRVAATRSIQDLFVRTVLLAPYLGYDAPTNRPHVRRLGQCRHSALPRARRRCAGSASTAASSCRCSPSRCRRIRTRILASTYSDRLMRNFATSTGYRVDLAGGDASGRRSSAVPTTK